MTKTPNLCSWLADNHKKKEAWRPLYVGIDPGAAGAIAVIAPFGAFVADMPVVKTPVKGKGKRKTRTDYDLKAVVELFHGLQGFGGDVRACVEVTLPQIGSPKSFHKGGKRFTTGGKSAWNAYRVGMGYYMWPLFLLSKGYAVTEVHPHVWKAKAGLTGKGKNVSLRKARKFFPDVDLRLKKHEGRAEALLIARHCKRLHEEERNA